MATNETATDDSEPYPDYLQKEAPTENVSTIGTREAYCKECERRVTRSPTKKIEYGHERTCEHKIGEENAPNLRGERNDRGVSFDE